MKIVLLFLGLLFSTLFVHAQDEKSATPESPLTDFRSTAARINDLVHTKLDVSFDYDHAYMMGKAWITLKPHFYSTDSLNLDAKGMEIKKLALVKGSSQKPLKYDYDGWNLRVQLDKEYKGGEEYTVYIDYVAKPNEVQVKGSAAINDAKGLYFINPKGEEKDKPTQIWTQGETEATSVWCPTIDKPNQKSTEEISMTVPAKYVTLSNGKLVSQKNNSNGTRTDSWKMDQPHAPYLFFMGVGDFAVVKDKYKDKEVNYYVEKKWEPVARKIFGETPAMMAYFSKITGVDYPWVKYSQIVGRDYVSGAMENTTATLHQESAYQDARELVDGNSWEETIAHELFHQWFGDYVTTESWSNLTLNESFANYSEYLWDEYRHGKDAADAHNYEDMMGYIMSGSENKDLVRYHYADKEDMFDAVSYNKGGRILNMLRNYVGDSAFFKSLNLYLTTNKYKSAEVANLRLAFEEITGKDLHWFFNQWYYGAGHPQFDIQYSYDEGSKKETVIINQKQEEGPFYLPVAIDIYSGGKKQRQMIWTRSKTDTLTFDVAAKPDLVNFDGDKVLLCTKKENKDLAEYLYQYQHAGLYLDRREAIDFAARKQLDPTAMQILQLALKDPYDGLRAYAIGKLDLKKTDVRSKVETELANIAKADKSPKAKGAALAALGQFDKPEYAALFKSALNDSSYTVAGNALAALAAIDSSAALEAAKTFSKAPAKGELAAAITQVMVEYGDESAADFVFSAFENIPFSQEKFDALRNLIGFVMKVQQFDNFKRGVDDIAKLRDDIPSAYQDQLVPALNQVLQNIAQSRADNTEFANYVKSKISTTDDSKKGF